MAHVGTRTTCGNTAETKPVDKRQTGRGPSKFRFAGHKGEPYVGQTRGCRIASETEQLHENSVRLPEQLRRYDLPALDGRVGQGACEEVAGSGIHQGCRPSLLHHASLPRDRATVVVAKWFGPFDDRKQRWRDQFRHCSFGTLIRSSDNSSSPLTPFTNRPAARERAADLSGDLRPQAHRLRFAAMIASRVPAWPIAWTGFMRRRGELRPELRFGTRATPRQQQGLPTTDFRRMIGLSSYDQ